MLVAQVGCDAGLVQETRHHLLVVEKLGPHALEGNGLLKMQMRGLGHDAHSTPGDALAYEVLAVDDISSSDGTNGLFQKVVAADALCRSVHHMRSGRKSKLRCRLTATPGPDRRAGTTH
jgi:hypothetical protein